MFFEVFAYLLQEYLGLVDLDVARTTAAQFLGPVAHIDTRRAVGVVVAQVHGAVEEVEHVGKPGEHVALGDVTAGGQVSGPGGDVPGPHPCTRGLHPQVTIEPIFMQNDETMLGGLCAKANPS